MDKQPSLTTKKTYYKEVFYISMLASALIFIIALFMTGGEAMGSLLFHGNDNTFMDFFNSLLYNLNDPYENSVFYPPLSTIMYKALLLLVPKEAIETYIYAPHSTAFNTTIKLRQEFLVPFILYFIVTFVALYVVLKNAKKGSLGEKLLFTFIIITSAPMVFLFERANNIIVVLIALLTFLGLYRSDSRIMREISLIALGVAITTKMYPIVFCALLFKDKRYKDIIKVGIYTFLLFFVPFFLFYDGMESIRLMLSNLNGFSGASSLNTGVQLNFAKMIVLPLSQFNGISNELLEAAGEFFRIAMMFIAVPAVLFTKKDWKCAALCCCIIYGYQGTCATYLLTMFCIPIMLMLDGEKEHSVKNYFCLAFMILTQCYMVSINPMNGEFTRYVSTKVSSYAVMFLTIILSIDGLRNMFRLLIEKHGISKKTCTILSLCSSAIVLFATLFVVPGSILNLVNLPTVNRLSAHTKNMAFCILAAGIFVLTVFIIKYNKNKAELEAKFTEALKKHGATLVHAFITTAISAVFTFINPGLYAIGFAIGFIAGTVGAYFWLNRYFFKKLCKNKANLILKTLIGYGITFIASALTLLLMKEIMGIPVFIAMAVNLVVIVPFDVVVNDIITSSSVTARFKGLLSHFNITKDKSSGKD